MLRDFLLPFNSLEVVTNEEKTAGWLKIADSIYLYTCYSDAMIQTRMQKTAQNEKVQQAQAALAKLLADSSQHGFHGKYARIYAYKGGLFRDRSAGFDE